MNKYQEGKIYRIIADDTNKCYYGSTIQTLYSRFSKHKERKDNCVSKEMFIYQNPIIELVENWPCDSNLELIQREQYHIEQNKDIAINKNRAYSTPEEKKQQEKDHYKTNKEKIINRSANRYINKKEEILEQMKEYREKNSDIIKARKKAYYEKNKININANVDKEQRKIKNKHYYDLNKIKKLKLKTDQIMKDQKHKLELILSLKPQ